MLSMALTKGRLEKNTVAMLDECGYGTEALKNKGRALVFKDTKKDLEYFLVKANDCITYVEHGVADVGVVGKDTLLEGGKDYYELLDLEIGKCRFIVASLPQNDLFNKTGQIKIGTKYPKVARDYFLQRTASMSTVRSFRPRMWKTSRSTDPLSFRHCLAFATGSSISWKPERHSAKTGLSFSTPSVRSAPG